MCVCVFLDSMFSMFCAFAEVMHTLISSCSMLFSIPHDRWLTPDEMLTLQGFPVRARFSYGSACCSFARHKELEMQGLVNLPRNSRSSICHMAGNSMHCQVIGLVILFGMLQVKLDPTILRLIYHNNKSFRNASTLVLKCTLSSRARL